MHNPEKLLYAYTIVEDLYVWLTLALDRYVLICTHCFVTKFQIIDFKGLSTLESRNDGNDLCVVLLVILRCYKDGVQVC